VLRKLPALTEIGLNLDQISYDWLSDQYPDLLAAIENAVAQDVDPITVRRFVMSQTGRHPLALRCQQVARAIKRSLDDN